MTGKIGIGYSDLMKGSSFNRLLHGPTWGLSRASSALALAARDRDLNLGEIQTILSHFSKVEWRLAQRQVDFEVIPKGMKSKNIAKASRILLYRNNLREDDSKLQASLAQLGFLTGYQLGWTGIRLSE